MALNQGQKKNLKIFLGIALAIGALVAVFHPTSRAWLQEKWNMCKDTVTGWFSKKA